MLKGKAMLLIDDNPSDIELTKRVLVKGSPLGLAQTLIQ
jgi:hypothetical protein